MPKKCIICEGDAKFSILKVLNYQIFNSFRNNQKWYLIKSKICHFWYIKDSSEFYCKWCAEESFGDLGYLEEIWVFGVFLGFYIDYGEM